jgi:iron complex outermembrane receptor protein
MIDVQIDSTEQPAHRLRSRCFIRPSTLLLHCLAMLALGMVASPAVLADEPLQEIIVTAQKYEQSAQKVPISMTVLTGKELDKSTAQSVAEILNTVPGVSTLSSYQGGGTLVTVRGVSAGEALLNGAGTVGYYLDSVPFGLVKDAIGPDENAYDMQRIEVLRGPQGTLYGANALNGVVRVLTNDANLQDFEFKARASGSSTDGGGVGFREDMAINVPIIADKLAARVVVGYQDDDGWIDTATKKNFNDAHLLNLRLKVNAQPTDALSVGLSVWSSRNTYGGPSTGDTPNFNSSVFPEPIHNDYDTTGLKVAYQFDGFTVSSMTGYLDYKSTSNLDFTPFEGVPSDLGTDIGSRVFSEEVLATSNGSGPWRWSLGDMYRRATEDLGQQIQQFAFGLHYIDESKSNAVYGEATRLLFDDSIELTGGLRYFHDDISQQDQTGLFNPNGIGINAPVLPGQSTAAATTPRGVITWHPSEDWTIYGSYSQGFRSGFPQNAPASVVEPAHPDRLTNYELGSKGSLFGGRIKVDFATYYMDWKDVQQNVTVMVGTLPFSATVNGKSASGLGVDLALSAEPIDRLILGTSFSWNDLAMDSNVYSAGALIFPKGDRLNLSPEYTASASAGYDFPLGASGLNGHFSLSGNYVSNLDNRVLLGSAVAEGRGAAEFIPRAAISVISKAGWTGTLFADNFSNYQKSPVPGYGTFPQYYERVRPRTVGMQIEYKY